MNKLEIKHLAPYLPYGLEVLRLDNITTLKVLEISFDGIISVGENAPKYCNIKGVKPILRPINSITKEEARELINTIFNCKELTSDLSTNYLVYEYLLKHHFDVFGLIEKGLAIDKNTIE